MQNAGLDKTWAGINTAGRNINNLRCADNTTLMAESEEELKSFLMKVKEEWKSWLKTQHSENKDHGIWSHHFMPNKWGNNGNSKRLYWGSKITADGDCSHEIKRHLLLGRKAMTNLDKILKNRHITLPMENPADRGAWTATVHKVAKSWTWLKRLSMQELFSGKEGDRKFNPRAGGAKKY